MKKLYITLLFVMLSVFSFAQRLPDTAYYVSHKQLIVPTGRDQYYEDSTYELTMYKTKDVKYLKIQKGRKSELYTVDQIMEVDSAFQIDDGNKGILIIFSATKVAPEWDNVGIQVAIFLTSDDIHAIGVGDALNIKVYSVEGKLQQTKL